MLFFSFLYIDIIYPRELQFSHLIDCLYVDHAAIYPYLSSDLSSSPFVSPVKRKSALQFESMAAAAAASTGVATVPVHNAGAKQFPND